MSLYSSWALFLSDTRIYFHTIMAPSGVHIIHETIQFIFKSKNIVRAARKQ